MKVDSRAMPSLGAVLVVATSCLAFAPTPLARRTVRPLGRVAAADLDVESTSASRFGFGVTASDASDAQGIEQPVDDEWGEFRVVKIPANREEMIFAFMQYAKCERLEAQDEVDAFLASSAKREYWRQIQEDERANPMPQPPTNAQKIFYQVRQVVRFGLFIAAGYYVGGPIRDFLTQKATDA